MENPVKTIGILTFHYAHNYGAMLQTYALRTYLIQQGYDVHIINYRSQYVASPYKEHYSALQLVGRRGFVLPWHWIDTVKKLSRAHLYQAKWMDRIQKFSQFERDYLLDSGCTPIAKEEIERLNYDAFIFGSDQIWNTSIIGKGETVYWGRFQVEQKKKIVYGASVLRKVLTPLEQHNVKQCLDTFDAVSVRERSLSEQIEKITGRRIPVVVDPTMLLLREDYERLVDSAGTNEQPYTLLYMMWESKEAIKAAKKIGLPLKIVGCRGNELVRDMLPGKILDAGPIEFLNLVSHASYVLTNSFHGTIFSILFQRPFCVILGDDARIDNLLNLTGLQKARVPNARSFSTECLVQSTEKNEQKLKEAIGFSKQYLSDALNCK